MRVPDETPLGIIGPTSIILRYFGWLQRTQRRVGKALHDQNRYYVTFIGDRDVITGFSKELIIEGLITKTFLSPNYYPT